MIVGEGALTSSCSLSIRSTGVIAGEGSFSGLIIVVRMMYKNVTRGLGFHACVKNGVLFTRVFMN